MTNYNFEVHRLNQKLFRWEPITNHERYLIYRVLSEDAQYEMGALADAIDQEAFFENKLGVAGIDEDEFKVFTGLSDEAIHYWGSKPIYDEAKEVLTYLVCCCHYEKHLSDNKYLFTKGCDCPDVPEEFLYPYDYQS